MLERLKRLLGGGGGPTAARQQGDPTVLDRRDDPRGGTQSDAYRHADPRDVVEEGGTTMSGPAGSPQEGLSPDERRERDFGPAAQRSQAEPGGRDDAA